MSWVVGKGREEAGHHLYSYTKGGLGGVNRCLIWKWCQK